MFTLCPKSETGTQPGNTDLTKIDTEADNLQHNIKYY